MIQKPHFLFTLFHLRGRLEICLIHVAEVKLSGARGQKGQYILGKSEPGQSSAIIATRSPDDFAVREEVEDDIEVERSVAEDTGSCTRQHAKYP